MDSKLEIKPPADLPPGVAPGSYRSPFNLKQQFVMTKWGTHDWRRIPRATNYSPPALRPKMLLLSQILQGIYKAR